MKTNFTDEEISELILEWEIPRFIFDIAIRWTSIHSFIISECTKLIKPVLLINKIQSILDLSILTKDKQKNILQLIIEYEN